MAHEVSIKVFGFPTRLIENPVTNSVATTATKILNNNPDRVFWLAINLSAQDGYVGFSREVSSTRGVLVTATGGFVSMSAEEDGESVAYEVLAISPGGAGTWYIIEIEKLK